MSGLIHCGAWDGREYVNDSRRMILFEPQADAFRQLTENLGHRKNAILVNVALGAKKGTAEMHVSHPSHSSSILSPAKHHLLYPGVVFNGTESVRVSTLDAEMRGYPNFDHLVIDVQGYELEVMKGAKRTLHQIQRIKCEVNWDEVYKDCARLDEVDEFLKERGFRRTKLIRHSQGMCGDAYYRR